MLNKDLTQVTLLLQMTTNLYPRKLLYGLIAISLSLTACTKDNIVIQPAQEYVDSCGDYQYQWRKQAGDF